MSHGITARSSAMFAALLVLLSGVAGCVPSEPDSSPTKSETPPATPSPSPSPTPTPVEPEEPEAIVLSAAGVGDVALNTPGVVPDLLDLLGPADDDGSGIEQPGTDDCGGPGNLSYVNWGDLGVILTSGSLYGWTLRGTDVPDGVTTEHAILPGDPLADVLDIPAPAPDYLENFDALLTNLAGVGYWAHGADASTATVFMIAVNPITCG